MRIHGRISLAAALLWAGMAHAADKPEAAKTKADDGKIIMLTGSNGKAHKCQILRTYKHPSGGMAMEVKDLETGETMTVVDNSGTPTAGMTTTTSAKTTTATKAETPTTAQLAATTTTMPKSKAGDSDPIMQPKEVASTKAQKQLTGETGKPAKADKKSETSASAGSKRWGGKPAEVKVASSGPAIAIAAVPPMEASQHPDPVIRLIGCLRDDMMPSMREIAAESLAQSQGRARPEVIAALAEAAEKDPAPTVRACCVRCLTTMSASSPECMAALHKVKAGSDSMIRTASSNSK